MTRQEPKLQCRPRSCNARSKLQASQIWFLCLIKCSTNLQLTCIVYIYNLCTFSCNSLVHDPSRSLYLILRWMRTLSKFYVFCQFWYLTLSKLGQYVYGCGYSSISSGNWKQNLEKYPEIIFIYFLLLL